MSQQSIKYGIDRCPATKNYSDVIFCKNCDFKSSTGKDCCECLYHKFGKHDDKKPLQLH